MKSLAQKTVQRLLEAEDLDWEPDPNDPDDSLAPVSHLKPDPEAFLQAHGYRKLEYYPEYSSYCRNRKPDGWWYDVILHIRHSSEPREAGTWRAMVKRSTGEYESEIAWSHSRLPDVQTAVKVLDQYVPTA